MFVWTYKHAQPTQYCQLITHARNKLAVYKKIAT